MVKGAECELWKKQPCNYQQLSGYLPARVRQEHPGPLPFIHTLHIKYEVSL